ncbi:MAG: hypothetical protein D6832_02555 [Alphaproteobacteria bacterium]|nr:MAG: hypothetical protein D6832_02555 [Alphaproteobacteria bacterium]
MSVIDWLEGPLWRVSATVFVVFALWRLGAVLTTGRRRPEMPPQGSPAAGALRTTVGHFWPRRIIRRRGKTWFVTLAGYAFHLGLFTLLLFAAPHVAFIRAHIAEVALPVLPRWGFIVAAEFAFAGLLALWVRRFVDPVVRFISRPDDHIGAGLTFLVMLTGCMALGQQSVALRAIHLGLAELWLVYFPFSSLMHTFTWLPSRLMTGAAAGRRGVTW